MLSIVWNKLRQINLLFYHTCNIVCIRIHRASSCSHAAHPLSTRRWLAAQRIANHFFPFHCISFFATVFPSHAQGCFTFLFHFDIYHQKHHYQITIKIKKVQQFKAFHFRIARSSLSGFAKIISTLRVVFFLSKTLTASVPSLLQNAFFFHFFSGLFSPVFFGFFFVFKLGL